MSRLNACLCPPQKEPLKLLVFESCDHECSVTCNATGYKTPDSDIDSYSLLCNVAGRTVQRSAEQLGDVNPGTFQIAEQRHRADQLPVGEKVPALSQF